MIIKSLRSIFHIISNTENTNIKEASIVFDNACTIVIKLLPTTINDTLQEKCSGMNSFKLGTPSWPPVAITSLSRRGSSVSNPVGPRQAAYFTNHKAEEHIMHMAS